MAATASDLLTLSANVLPNRNRFEKLSRLATHLKDRAYSWTQDQLVDWVVGEIQELVELLGGRFEREGLNEEIIGLQLYTEDDRPIEDEDEN